MKFHNRQSHQEYAQHSSRPAARRWLAGLSAAVTLALSTAAVAIHPGVWDHTTEADFNKGDAVGVVVTNLGDIKLAADRSIYHAGLLLVLFCADEATAEHDLAAWEDRTLRKGYPIAPPVQRRFPLNDRLGNTTCATALFPIRRL